MPKAIAFLLLLFSSTLFAQSDSLGFKTVAFDLGVVNYQIQSANDTTKAWSTITTIQPTKKKDSNLYAYPLTTANIYYRIKSQMIGNIYYSPAMLYSVQSSNSVTISKTKVSTSWWTDKLTWSTSNESNVSYYLLEYSSGKSWITETKILATGNGNYGYTNSRGWFSKKPSYRITPFFINGIAGSIVYF